MTTELWAVEWNYLQDCPHIEPIKKYLTDSRSKALSGENQDWILIDISNSQEEASHMANFAKDVIRNGYFPEK